MAANTPTRAGGFAYNTNVTATEFTKLDTNGAGAVARASTSSGNRRIPLCPVEMIDQAGGGLGTRMGYCTGGTITTFNLGAPSCYLWIPLPGLPHKHVLSSVTMSVMPAGAHGGQPVVLPSIDVYRIDGSGSAGLLGTGSHTWVDVATYETGIDLVATLAVFPISNSLYTYWARFTLESGVNSVTGLVCQALYANCTIDNTYGGPDHSFWV
jgi:hypothetical protein